jgi:type I restriction enzyme R subunit
MYVDKNYKALAVQALSKIKWAADKLRIEDLFVLDFFNSTEDMKILISTLQW